ncbi:hypothetical protein L596_005522 [Steinernema carpocapsae]|uniref:Uncharacterized protein n=1 Tax=Steinernema carpocapsae TaxID=34508 RepID=A0A4U8V473_STECR|nr:hypothetical protein L596_005522 [Steinernema carpocapsae]
MRQKSTDLGKLGLERLVQPCRIRLAVSRNTNLTCNRKLTQHERIPLEFPELHTNRGRNRATTERTNFADRFAQMCDVVRARPLSFLSASTSIESLIFRSKFKTFTQCFA